MTTASMSAGLPTAFPIRADRVDAGGDPLRKMGIAIVGAAVLFNGTLAFVNAHAFALSGGLVSLVQAAITLGALTYAVLCWRPAMLPWAIFLWAGMLLSAALALARQELLPKLIADIITIPAFVMLGITARRRDVVVALLGLQAIITVFAIFELASPGAFGKLLNVRGYYVNTRGFADTAFWSENADLFLSSQRPGGRLLLPQSGLHRASSLFLEPVSLGNWAVIAMVGVLAFWRSISVGGRVFMLASTLLLLFACDGRLALFVCLGLLVTMPFAHRLPRGAAFMYLPLLVAGLFGVQATIGLHGQADTFIGRLAYSMAFLQRLDFPTLLGLSASSNLAGADSGLGYLIVTQSFLGAVLVWGAITLLPRGEAPIVRKTVHGVAFYVTLCLPISYSLFSIKTAAPMWYLYGSAIAEAWRMRQTNTRGLLP